MPYTGQSTNHTAPTIEFYQQDPKALAVRGDCVNALRAMSKYEAMVGSQQSEARASIFTNVQRLQQRGILSNQHEGRDALFFRDNPLGYAEYGAGQIIALLEFFSAEYPTRADIEPQRFRRDNSPLRHMSASIAKATKRPLPAADSYGFPDQTAAVVISREAMVRVIAKGLDAERDLFAGS